MTHPWARATDPFLEDKVSASDGCTPMSEGLTLDCYLKPWIFLGGKKSGRKPQSLEPDTCQFRSWLRYLLGRWLQAGHFTSLSLRSLIFKGRKWCLVTRPVMRITRLCTLCSVSKVLDPLAEGSLSISARLSSNISGAPETPQARDPHLPWSKGHSGLGQTGTRYLGTKSTLKPFTSAPLN